MNQKRLRTLKENENCLGILEADIIKQAEMKEKKKKKKEKRVPQTSEKTFGNQTLQQKPHQRDKLQGSLYCKILWTILKID